MAGTTFTWTGGSGDWFTASQWRTTPSVTGPPTTGDDAVINSGTVSVNGSEEITNVPVDGDELTPLNGQSVTLGARIGSAPATIVATSALFGRYFTIASTGTYAEAVLAAVGPTGYNGAIIANASGGSFTIQATQADASQPADLVLLNGASVNVSNGDDLVLNGLLTAEANITIAAGGTLTNDGTVRMFAGGTTLSADSVVNGSGTFIVGPDSTLFAETAIPSSQTIAFDGAGRVEIGTLATFSGHITDFAAGSEIDLLGTVVNYAIYDAVTGLVTLENNGTAVGTLSVQGPASGLLSTTSDGAGGTYIEIPGSASRTSYEIDTAAQAVGANVVEATMTTVAGAPIIGTGITIGIMSDSFNATLNGVVDPADTAAADGYLPATAAGKSAVDVLKDSSVSGVDNEGLAMAELVHQIAPGAAIDFYTAEGGQESFAQGVTALVQAGANIIVDDWSFDSTPFFQIAGPVDTAVENAISAGVDYFTSGGNFGDAYYASTWQPLATQLVLQTGQPAQDVTAQQFSNGTPLQTITMPGSTAAAIDLQWAVPWPAAGGSVPDPIAMALYTTSGSLVATSQQIFDSSAGYGYIPEITLSVPVTATTTQYELAIYLTDTTSVSQFEYILFGSPGTVAVSSAQLDDGSTVNATDPGGIIDDPAAGQGPGDVFGQKLVPGVNTVGAAYWSNSPAFEVSPDWTEYFSSSGPGELLFNQNGTALATPDLDGKVDFVAPDGVQTSVPGFQGFYGTSAASPDAAAVAALMLQADPSLTTSEVTTILENTAVSMDLPAADQGAGLIQATGAVQDALTMELASRTLQWTGAAGTSFANANNWDDLTDNLNPATSPPDAADIAVLSTGSGTITGTGTVSVLEVNDSGNWTLGAGANVTDSSVSVGDSPSGGLAALTLSDGAALTGDSDAGTAVVGAQNSGAVTVDGEGSTWSIADGLLVGDGAAGQVIASDGGSVAVGSYVDVGETVGSTGSVSVNDGQLSVGSALYDGYSGSGMVAIGALGTVTIDGLIEVGDSAGAAGVLSISGGGVLQDTAAPASNYAMDVGIAGPSGTLAAAVGSVVVSGAGSVLNLGTNGLAIGEDGGVGTVTVSQGGTFIAGTESSSVNDALAIGRTGDGTMIVTDPGSEMEANGEVYVAHSETGDLIVENYGTFLAAVDPAGVAGLEIGDGSTIGAGGLATATVTTDGILVSQGYIIVGAHGTPGDLAVSDGGTVEVGTSLIVGDTNTLAAGMIAAGDGSMSIGAGSTVELTGAPSTTTYEVNIGDAASSVGATNHGSGELTLSGAGALLDTNGGAIAVGEYTNGVLNIGQGATVEAGTPNSTDIAALSVGRQGDGNVIVDGGSLIANGQIYIGRAGTGDLLVENDGILNVGTDGADSAGSDALYLGTPGASNGTIYYVGGTGSMQVSSDGTVTSQLPIYVGDDGTTGDLSINSGGVVEADQQIAIGRSTTIAAGDSLISSGGTTVLAVATVEAGDGSVDIGPGGTLAETGTLADNTSGIVIGDGNGATGDVTVHGTGALLSTGGNRLGLGGAGDGSLTISQGGTVLAGTSFADQQAVYIAGTGGTDTTGAITVTDPGSSLTAIGQIDVGDGGTGSLLIENQASVFTGGNTIAPTQGFDVGTDAGAAGSVTVTGDESLLDNTGRFIVGDAGVGSMSIESGGTVITTPGTVAGLAGAMIANTTSASGSGVDVTGAGSDWQITGTLQVGNAAQGALDIASGATVTAGALVAAAQSGGDGVITVAGTNSLLQLTGSVTLGAQGAGELAILSGATASALDLTIGGSPALSSGNVDVEGAGSELSIAIGGALNIGVADGGSGVLTIGSAAVLNFAGIPVESGHASFNNYGTVDPDGFEYTTASNGNAGLNLYDLYIGNIGAVQVSAGTSTWFTPMVLTGTSVADAANNIGNNGDVGEWQLSNGGTLVFNANTVDAGQAIVFEDATDTLVIGQQVDGGQPGVSGETPTVSPGAANLLAAGGFAAELWGYQAGDQILFDNLVVNSDSIVGGNTLELFGAGGTLLGELTFYNKAGTRPLGSSGMAAAAAQLECFAAGTRLLTARGEVAVEAIAVGERVRVLLGDAGDGRAGDGRAGDGLAGDGLGGDGLGGDGLAEVIWVGRREVDCARHPQPGKVWPVWVAAGAFGPGRPHSDLWLSPDHAVYVAEVLIPVKYLINGSTIVQVPVDSITYHHIELAQHDVLLAEGLPVESYLDIKDGRNYPERAAAVRLYPDYTARMWEAFGCARLVVTGPELAAARALVAEVAGTQEAA